MASRDLDGLRVAIVLDTDFEQVEMTEPRKALEYAGATCRLISPKNQVTGVKHEEKQDTFKVDLPLDRANPDEFDALLLPGGALNADSLRMVKQAQEFVRRMDQAGKPMAVICHAPWVLVSSGLAKGRHLTSYHTIQDDMINAGANWEDRAVIVDRNLVSSRQPSDIPAFNREMIRLFGETRGRNLRAA
ncbi:MAG: type 1 glutamine amidotransferase domain-containing protein [Terriglobales bacterium]